MHSTLVKQRRVRQHGDCAKTWQRAPGSKAAHAALRRLAHVPCVQGIAALRHPVTGELGTSTAERAGALAAHYSALARAQQPGHPDEIGQARQSEATVMRQRAGVDDGPDVLSQHVTLEEVQAGLRRMANHKAPGEDDLPAELLKSSGEEGARALRELFNTILTTECIPRKWRQGVIVSAYKAGDATDCGNYRGLTLLPAMDKLWSILVTARLEQHVPLHDHQYAFRKHRGTTNALFNMTSTIRTRHKARQGTFVFFLDAKKAYDTVPHPALLARLEAKGVTGKLWRIIDSMYSNAHSRVRVDGVLSDPFPIRRGVAQGCPLSPLLYNIFADSLLDAVHEDAERDGVPVAAGLGLRGLVLTGQSYADDLAAVATSAAGLQRVIHRVHAHSLKWGWTANTQKSVVVVFGTQAVRDEAAGATWYWGDEELSRVTSVKYLGLHFHETCSWGEHVARAADKTNAALNMWAPVLASPTIPVHLKSHVIKSRVLPVLQYGMEVWAPEYGGGRDTMLAPLDAAVMTAGRLACGLRGTPTQRGWERRRGVCPQVLQADMRLLQASLSIDLAHARYDSRALANERRVVGMVEARAGVEAVPPLPVAQAPDCLGAQIRAALPHADAWRTRVRRLQPSDQLEQRTAGTTSPAGGYAAAAQALAAGRRRREAAAAPLLPEATRSGRGCKRVREPDPHYNPVPAALAEDADRACYLHAPDNAVWPIMALRSAHLPGDHATPGGPALCQR